MGTRFVSVPADELLSMLRSCGEAVENDGGSFREWVSGREVVCDITPPASPVVVRVYTSIAKGDAEVRGCGDDAIRIVVGAAVPDVGWRAVTKPRRIFRTAPQGPEVKRVEMFLHRFREALREAYRLALDTPRCPDCDTGMAQRSGARGGFWGCLAYPTCRGTRELRE